MATNLSTTVTLTNSDTGVTYQVAGKTSATTNDDFDAASINVATSETSYTISTELVDPGFMYVVNRGPTNFVQLGFATTRTDLKLLVDVPQLLYLDGSVTTLYFKADTAACRVEFIIYDQ